MHKVAKLSIAGLLYLNIITGCSDKKTLSPYDELLHQPPFSSLSDSIERDPSNEELWFRRAVLLNTRNLPEPALEDFRMAWSLKKEERFALGIGTLLMDKKPDSALVFLRGALRELPESFLLRLSLARTYAAMNQPAPALNICDEILARNPRLVDVIKLKADLLDKQNRTPEATGLWEQAYRMAPFDVELNYILALRYAEAKNPKVLALCDSLIRADTEGNHAEPYYYKGIYYASLGDRSAALRLFEEAVKHDYYFLDGYIEKGSLLFEMKKYEDALSVLNLALTISPGFADAYYWIAKCQEATGKKEAAKANYLRAFELDKSLIEARTAAEKIIN